MKGLFPFTMLGNRHSFYLIPLDRVWLKYLRYHILSKL